ncbi:MAG: helix-turn-helix domain-containing protein, partial [Terriglobia bacterium]
MSRVAAPIILSAEERTVLTAWSSSRSLPFRLVQRARIISMAAGATLGQDIAQALDISRPTVQLWRERFLALRLAGLEKDAPRPGRIPSLSPRKVQAVVEATLHTKPSNATHWSV